MAKPFDRPARRQLPSHLQAASLKGPGPGSSPGSGYSLGHSSTPGLPIPVDVAPQGDMDATQAKAACSAIRHSLEDARARLLDLHDRKGWKALGYPSWRECAMAEFGKSQAQIYRWLEAARVDREISPIGEKPPLPESIARELAKAPEGRRAEALGIAHQATGAKPTAKDVARAVASLNASGPETQAVDAAIAEALTCSRCGQPLPTGSGVDPGPDA
jgi:hypothetical protein